MSTMLRLVLIIILLPGVVGFAQADDMGALLHLLQPIKSLSANFTQSTIDQDKAVIESSTGKFVAGSPNRFRWETDEPYPQLILSDGSEITIFDPDLKQANIKPLDENYRRSPAMFFAGDAAGLANDYHVSQQTVNTGNTVFRLTPKQDLDLFDTLEIHFSGGTPAGMMIFDSLGQVSQLEFSGVVINPAVSDAQFIFTAPEGTEIIRKSELKQ